MYKVIKDFRGSPDGHSVVDYRKDDVVEMADSLAEVAIAQKWVEKPRGTKSAMALSKEAAAQLQAEIAALQAAIDGAADSDKLTLQEQLSAKLAQLPVEEGA